MNAASGALITDAKAAMQRSIAEAVESDPLTEAFVGWLRLPGINVRLPGEIAAHAANVRGASRSYREVAILGFTATDPAVSAKHADDFKSLLVWLMARPLLLGGDPTPMMADPVAMLGISLGGRVYLQSTQLTDFEAWLRRVQGEAQKFLDEKWPGPLALCLAGRADTPEWVKAGLAARLVDYAPTKPDLARIINETITGAGDLTVASEASLRLAALQWATERALDLNLSSLAVADVERVLERTGTVFTRWVWEDKPRKKGKAARRWHVENEYHFQSLLFAVLKPLLPELEEEQYLASTGALQPRADLCLLSLALLVEVKFWYRRDSVSRLIEEVAADITLYLKSKAPYTALIVAIWDDGARTEEHAGLKRSMGELDGVRGVVIVNRPSWME